MERAEKLNELIGDLTDLQRKYVLHYLLGNFKAQAEYGNFEGLEMLEKGIKEVLKTVK